MQKDETKRNQPAEGEYPLKNVSIRLVEEPPLLSSTPLDSPEAAVSVLGDWLGKMDRELICILNLQSDGRPISMNVCSMGSINEAIANPREIMKSAILSNAAQMMLIHNHPSSSLAPSKEDTIVTDRMQQAGQLLGIPLVDHIIVGRDKEYYSFRENDILPYKTQNFQKDPEQLRFDEVNVAESKEKYQAGLERKPSVLTQVLEDLEKGIQDLFESKRYKEYLKVMSRFHNYSFNNSLLISMQKPEATYVAGYQAWQDKFDRHVRKGEKGIRILAPAPRKQWREVDKLDPATGYPIVGKDGRNEKEKKLVTVPSYKVMTVFDISQTDGKELPEIVTRLQGDVEGYQRLFSAIRQVSPVPVEICDIDGTANGYYHQVDKRIAIQEGMGQMQTIKTAVHEVSHALLHDKATGLERNADAMTKEVEAESIAYAVCQHYGIDTSDYSFGYIAGWSSGKELNELKEHMHTIWVTASNLIRSLDDILSRMEKEDTEENGPIASMEESDEKGKGLRDAGPMRDKEKGSSHCERERQRSSPKRR